MDTLRRMQTSLHDSGGSPMRALIADDDPVTAALLRRLAAALESRRRGRGHDGAAAWESSDCEHDPPSLAILDWMMPSIDGLELCRRIRETPTHAAHVRDPADRPRQPRRHGRRARSGRRRLPGQAVRYRRTARPRATSAIRILTLQQQLTEQIAALRETLANVKQLKGLLPICSYCKRIRKDEDYWQQVEGYISEHSDAQFSHGICPGCFENVQEELTRHS